MKLAHKSHLVPLQHFCQPNYLLCGKYIFNQFRRCLHKMESYRECDELPPQKQFSQLARHLLWKKKGSPVLKLIMPRLKKISMKKKNIYIYIYISMYYFNFLNMLGDLFIYIFIGKV